MTAKGTRKLKARASTPRGLELLLAADERILLSSSGAFRQHVNAGWRPGNLCLTNERLLFSNGTGVAFEASSSEIHEVRVERQRYVLGVRRDAIAVIHQGAESPGPSVAYIIMSDLETWRNRLYELVSPELDEDTVEAVLERLGPGGQAIVEYLWENGHATSGELMAALGAPSSMDVLLEIRDRINPTARKIIGSPLLVAERAKVDESTGEKVLFSWWLVRRRGEGNEESGQPLVDIFDEEDHVDILMELVGLRGEDILLGVSEQGVVVSAQGEDNTYREEIPLPYGVRTDKFSKTYGNNVLVLRLEKSEGDSPD
ncbi:MAG: Hsp20/alpha crystallin family protein [Dehalococcoidia bacterium]